MKAIIFEKYGSPDVLKFQEVDEPAPADDEVLIRVHAASINDWDWAMIRGVPFVNRLSLGLFAPRRTILGADVAGRVAAVGTQVTRFKPGDEVFGDLCGSNKKGVPAYAGGAFAEYVCARETALMAKPANLSFEQAACLPQSGALMMQGLRQHGDVRPGQKVLINGASGGAGTLGVQVAKLAGAEVTGVCRTGKMDLVRSLGADFVIDYTRENFIRNGRQYDRVLDLMTHHSFSECRRSLSRDGIYVVVGGATGRIMQIMLLGLLLSWISSKKVGLLMYKPNAGVEDLLALVAAGKVKPVIDKVFPLSDTAEAFRYYAAGEAKGKVVISV